MPLGHNEHNVRAPLKLNNPEFPGVPLPKYPSHFLNKPKNG